MSRRFPNSSTTVVRFAVTRPSAIFAISILCQVLSITTASAQDDNYSAQRSASISASGVTTIRIRNGSGRLIIAGKQGAATISATGTARASSRDLLDKIKIAATRDGDVVTIEPQYPENGWFSGGWCNCSINMTVEVPSNIRLDVHGGSGGAEIHDVGAMDVSSGSGGVRVERVGGALSLRTGSGGANVRDVHGDVTAQTGSGGLTIEHVTGSVNVERAGSGSVGLREVSGSAHVGSIGSGSLDVDGVGGDLVVEHKGSGSVHYASVRGKVDVPDRGNHRYW